jgi:hypothetical protein
MALPSRLSPPASFAGAPTGSVYAASWRTRSCCCSWTVSSSPCPAPWTSSRTDLPAPGVASSSRFLGWERGNDEEREAALPCEAEWKLDREEGGGRWLKEEEQGNRTGGSRLSVGIRWVDTIPHQRSDSDEFAFDYSFSFLWGIMTSLIVFAECL